MKATTDQRSRLRRYALGGYYWTSMPWRRLRNWRACQLGLAPVCVLFYHRVADRHPNAWTISNAMFRRQIEWIERHFDIISLAEVQSRIQAGNSRPAVSITFDDGYWDNCESALPLLVDHGLPCTYFVATNHVLRGDPFPHDVRAGIELAPNNVDQLRWMAESGIEIGAHTRSHADLGAVDDSGVLHDELVVARHELQEAVGRDIRYFAFPYGLHGNLSVPAMRMARQAGYLAVCSAYGGYNFPGDDAFYIQRIHADPEMIFFKNWLTIDPRKIRRMHGYQGVILATGEGEQPRWSGVGGEAAAERITTSGVPVP